MIVLVIGGVRSGKSDLAAGLAADLGEPVTVVAPTRMPDDPELAARVRAHQERRPESWTTCECGSALPAALESIEGTALVDSLGTWVAWSPELTVDTDALVASLRRRPGDTVVVSEEVGLAVHPPTPAGRRFTDVLGGLNAAVSAVADRALLVVAGRVVTLEHPAPGR